MSTNRGTILTKSPYFITEVVSAGATSTIEIRVWNGSSTAEPADPNYSLRKQALSTTSTNVSFEICKIVNDIIEHKSNVYTISPTSGKTDSLWVNIKSFGGTTNRDDTWLALDGYSDFLDGINYALSTPILISERILYHYDNIPLRLPVFVSGSSNTNTVEFIKGGVAQSVTSYTSLTGSLNSYDKIQYVNETNYAPGDIDSIWIKNGVGGVIDTIAIVPMECTRYTPHIVSFINRFGANQELIFGLVSKNKITVKKDSYRRQVLVYTNGVPSYDTTRHNTKDYNSNVTEVITLNSNYIDESLNDTIGELISSETVWITSGGITYPVNVSTSTLDYKKSINEGLINYTISFDKAFDNRNTIY